MGTKKTEDETLERADSWLHSLAGFNIRDVKFSWSVTRELTTTIICLRVCLITQRIVIYSRIRFYKVKTKLSLFTP